jgi:hypothetical protein
MLDLLLVSLGVLLALFVAGTLIYLYVQDVTQEKHAVLRNFPLVGHLRYFFESLGEYFRQYFFLGDREDMPFDRATRSWVYRMAKNEGGIIGFGSTYPIHEPGALVFVNAPFPSSTPSSRSRPRCLSAKAIAGRLSSAVAGQYQRHELWRHFRPAVRALSRGAAAAGCWLDTGEGGLSPYHLEGGCDIIFQIGTAKYGVRDESGQLSDERLRELGRTRDGAGFRNQVVAGREAGQGGRPARQQGQRRDRPHPRHCRGPRLAQSEPSSRHQQHRAAARPVEHVRAMTGKPVGVKTAIGGPRFIDELSAAVARRGLQAAPTS